MGSLVTYIFLFNKTDVFCFIVFTSFMMYFFLRFKIMADTQYLNMIKY